MHEILPLDIEKLHFGSSLETHEDTEDICSLVIQDLWIIKEQKYLDKHEKSQDVEELMAILNHTQ